MNASRQFIEKLAAFLDDLRGRENGLVLALSGGPDSVALARGTAQLWTQAPGRRLVLAHLNHGLRGAESDGDEAFVRGLHGELAAGLPGIGFRCERIAVREIADSEGANLEHAARRLRYDWLARVAHEEGIRLIATGHSANDQAETVMHHLLRGAGLRGLRGIAPRRRLDGDVFVVRPLLRVTRREVMAFLEEIGQEYREDRTNQDLDRTRNRIRHRLLPALAREYNPRLMAMLCQLAEQARDGYRVYVRAARRLLARSELPRAGSLLIFNVEPLTKAPRGVAREAFRLAWARAGWPMRGMRYSDWDRLAAVARGEKAAVDLPGGIRARRRGRVVRLGRDS